jgi:hypothetical protein
LNIAVSNILNIGAFPMAPRLRIPHGERPCRRARGGATGVYLWSTALEDAQAGAQTTLPAEREALEHQQQALETARAAFVGVATATRLPVDRKSLR